MTTLYSLYNNPRHAMLVNPSGEVIYEIKTEKGISYVLRALPKKLGMEDEPTQFVTTGELNWNRPMSFRVGEGKSVPAGEFLRVPVSDSKVRRFLKMAEEHDKREFTSPTGEVYQWTLMGDTAKLRRKGLPDPLAIYTMEHGSLLASDKRAALVLSEEALGLLDLIVLTWVQVALLINTFKSKGMFASAETEWATASAGVHSATDY